MSSEPSKAEAAVEQDPVEDRPPSYQADESPPAYEVNESFDRQPDAAEEKWRLGSPLDGEAPCPEDWATRSKANLTLVMTPLVNITSWLRQRFRIMLGRDWYATLYVNAKNIPGLMRHGFHWSSANLVPGRGFIQLDNWDLPREIGFGRTHCNHTRVYKLKGHENTDIEWRGTLFVCSRKSSTITTFDLNCLTQDQIVFVRAWDWNSNPVYSYDRFRKSENFNVVYEGMSLEGWWSWSKPAPPSQGNPPMQAVEEDSVGES